MSASCSGNSAQCENQRCICNEGFSGVTDGADYSIAAVDCPGNTNARLVLHAIALASSIINFIRALVIFEIK